ncbi:hypothetical protein L9F63_010431, partial [Diploptera punctata]
MWSQSQPDTQSVTEDIYSQENENPKIWGRLYSVRAKILSLDLSEDEYIVGRSDICSIKISKNEVNEKVLNTISKLHCKILKIDASPGIPEVYLEDLSFNGTFVNGEKVGKSKRRILKNNDQISLASPQFKDFITKKLVQRRKIGLKYEIRSKYIVTRELGAGACGKVYLVFDKKTCQRFAMKIVQKKRFDTVRNNNNCSVDKVMNEVNILKALRHPCIIRVEDIVDMPDAVYIILELMEGGELFDRIKSSQQLSEPEAKLIFYQIVLAVKHLHDNKITHRDLKPENILLASDKDQTLVKVSDFGLSKFINSQSLLKTFCGTPLYVAPEILKTRGMGTYTEKVDIWSMGIILYICLCGYPPFAEGNSPLPLNEQIKRGTYAFHQRYWHNVSLDAVDLIKMMLIVDPKSRITIDEVLNHRWLKDNVVKTAVEELIDEDMKNRERSQTPLDEDIEPPAKKSGFEDLMRRV